MSEYLSCDRPGHVSIDECERDGCQGRARRPVRPRPPRRQRYVETAIDKTPYEVGGEGHGPCGECGEASEYPICDDCIQAAIDVVVSEKHSRGWAQAVREEREQCAKVVEMHFRGDREPYKTIAAAIRARGSA